MTSFLGFSLLLELPAGCWLLAAAVPPGPSFFRLRLSLPALCTNHTRAGPDGGISPHSE